MNKEILQLVIRSKFATNGQKSLMRMAALYCHEDGTFWLATKQIKAEIGRSRASSLEDFAILEEAGLIECAGKQGKIPKWRFKIQMLRRLANGEFAFKMRDVVARDRKGQPKKIDGIVKTRRAWRLVAAKPDSAIASTADGAEVQKGIQDLDVSGMPDPRFGFQPSEDRTQTQEIYYNNNLSASPRTAARESQQTRPHWGKWEVVRDPVKILEANPEEAHVAAFIHKVRKRLPPPPHFSADLFDAWVDALKVFPRDVLMKLADQQLDTREHWVDPLQILVKLATQIKKGEAAAAFDAGHVPLSPKAPSRLEYQVPDDMSPGLRDLDRQVHDKLDLSAHLAFRKLKVEVKGATATLSGNGFLIDQIEKNHKAQFEHLVRQCIPLVRYVDFKRDRIC